MSFDNDMKTNDNIPKDKTLIQIGNKFYTLKFEYELKDIKDFNKILDNNIVKLLA